ncbi:MAG: gliding motility-associated C-terminal domain-containing protein, partial [Saprospiraceae bacterium]|nr:gliding motility-associated C-terminal domain-containing protein [Saprospiraceae bacterium]
RVDDNCDQILPEFTEEIIPGVCENTHDIIRTWSAIDACGNSVMAQQQITVTDCRPEVDISINPNPVCLDGSVTFDAVITGNYSNPIYRWQFFWNGTWVDVPGGNVIPFTKNNIKLSDGGRYRLLIADHIQNLGNFDCNTVSDEAELIILQPVAVELNESICDGDSYSVGTSTYTQAGTYQDILTGSNGCDSIVNLNLSIIPNTEGFLDTTICDGERILVGETSLNRDGQFVVHLPNAAGCDSTVTVRLRIQYPSFTTIRDTICEGSSVTIAGETYTSGGSYTQVLADRFGCDSTLEIMIHEHPTVYTNLDVSICTGDSYTLAGQTFNSAGTFNIPLTSVLTGCDSIVVLNLQVQDEILTNLNQTICVGDSFAMAGKFYDSPGTYRDTVPSKAGCDSIITLVLDVVDQFITDLNIQLCEGETYRVGTSVYTVSGDYSDLLISSAGCDSIVNLHLVINPHKDTLITADICQGESISAGGERFSTTGVHTVVVPTATGCDSTITIDLTVHNALDTLYEVELCEGETFTLGGETYSTAGTYEQTFTTSFGCDSIITIQVQVFERYEQTLDITLCTGSTYQVGANIYSTTGNYTDSLISKHGCDSIIHLNLSIVDDIRDTLDVQICEGDSYTLGGTAYNLSGTYMHTFTSTAGCDSIVTVNLSVLDILRDTTIETICAGEFYDFDGSLLGNAGSYNKDYTSQAGCDSVHTLILSVTPVQRTNLFEEICAGEEFVLNGKTLTEGGTFVDTLLSVTGCDSIVTLNLRVNDAKSTTINRQICEGDVFDFNGMSLDSAGTYFHTLSTGDGCDSIVTLNLVVNPTYNEVIDMQICEGQIFAFDGKNLNTTGQYIGNFQTSKGCDSTVTLNLSVLTVLRDTTVASICNGETYVFDGTNFTVGGTYDKNYVSVTGCDSIQTLILTVVPVQRTTLDEELCLGDTVFVGVNPYTTTGTFVDTLVSAAGCDSIVTLNLRVNDAKSTTLNRQICEGEVFTFNGMDLDSTGVYYHTLPSQTGCDSVVTLNLQVNPVYREEIEAQICVGQIYPFDGKSLSATGEYTATFQTKAGCDSVVVLTLSVVDVINSQATATICNGDRYDFFGTMLSEEGTYQHTLQSSAGCDSVINLTLQIVDQIQETLSVSLCEGASYTFGSETLSESGTYRDTLLSSAGCDSIVTLNLVISPVYNEVLNAQICAGTSYRFMNQDLTTAGTYIDSLTTSAGCDSIVTLNLAVDDIKKDTTEVSICAGESFTFLGQSYSTPGTYEEVVGGIECDTLKVLVLSVQDMVTTNLALQICTGESFVFDGQSLTSSGTYTAVLTSVAGCDSTVTLALEVVDAIHTNLDYFICEGDSVVVNGTAYYEEGMFTDTLISAGGCDSILHLSIGQATAKFDTLDVQICEGETYTFNGNVYSSPTSLVDTFSSGSGCDSIVTFILDVKPVYEETVEVMICVGSSYVFDGKSYDAAGTYPIKYTSSSGCDSTINLVITVTDEIVTELSVQNCNGGSYDFNGQEITEAGIYRDTFVSASGCDSIVILDYQLTDVIETFETLTICEGDSILINDAYYYEATSFSDTSASILGCDSIAYHEIVVVSNVTLEGVDAEICEGESIQLEVQMTGNTSQPVTWTPADGLSCDDCLQPVASPKQTTTYKVSTSGCLGTNIETEVTVAVVPNPQLEVTQQAGPNGGQEVILSATTIDPSHTINWYDHSGQLICTDCPQILQIVTEESTFTAVASNYLGCEVSKDITVSLAQDDCQIGEIVATNAMTPNGDGSNDYFEVINTGDAEVTLIQIFNRWGEIVFEGNSVGQLWDGTFHGEPVNPGVFMYLIHGICVSGDTFILSGNVTVIR